MLDNLKQHILHVMLSNECTQCGRKQDTGEIFYDYGNKYLCQNCEDKNDTK